VLGDQAFDFAELMYRNSAIPGEQNRLEPKLALLARNADVDMWRFTGFIRIEVKAVRANSQDSRRWARRGSRMLQAALIFRKLLHMYNVPFSSQ